MHRSMCLRIWLSLALIAMATGLSPSHSNAGFLTIDDTDSAAVTDYLAATTSMAITGSDHSAVSSLTGPNLTIAFGPTVEKFQGPGWGNWSGPTIPDVLWTTLFATSVTFDFS